MLATLAIVVGFGALVGARPLVRRLSRHPTREQCAAMLDRYDAQLASAADPPGKPAPGHRDGPANEAVERCASELLGEEVDCALRSGYADELERCLP